MTGRAAARRRPRYHRWLAAAAIAVCGASSPAEEPLPEGGWALSLRELQHRLEAGTLDPEAPLPLHRLDGVYFDPSGDVVLIGWREGTGGRAAIVGDDVAVALRAMWLNDQPPGVSIDPVEDPTAPGGIGAHQRVVYFGGIEGTRAGLYALNSDYWMKRLAAGREPVPVPGFERYSDLVAKRRPSGEVGNRFWFYPAEARVATTPGHELMLFDRHGIEVLTEVKHSLFAPTRSRPEYSRRDPLAEDFAGAFTERYDELAAVYPDLGRLESFFALCELFRWSETEGLRAGRLRLAHWSYLLTGYTPVSIHTTASVRTVIGEVPGGVLIGGVSAEVRLPERPRIDATGRLADLATEILARRGAPGRLAWSYAPATGARQAGSPLARQLEKMEKDGRLADLLHRIRSRLQAHPLSNT